MKKIIEELLKLNIKSRADLIAAKRKLAKKYRVNIPPNSEIIKSFADLKPKDFSGWQKLLRRRSIRTLSGIAPVAVLTKPYPCPGNCAYCPTEKNVPQSYLSNEPAVMRAIRCNYNPYVQVQTRLRALEANGHEPTKIELIVIGGTWSALPRKYKYWFITECFRAANRYKKKAPIINNQFQNKLPITNYQLPKLKQKLSAEQKNNENTKYRLIGLTLETRPDYINKKELLEMRELGATRVELGVQATDNKILKLNKRGHDLSAITAATKLLKNYGFKVTYHFMPNLPGSTAAKDFKMYEQLFADERFQPDQIKFYPTVVTKGSLLYRWWQQGKYKPYSAKTLKNLIIKCKQATPPYVRIIRLIRDIPGESIVAGNRVTNLRQIMLAAGAKCRCIRCREARGRRFAISDCRFSIIKYQASGGEEYFISAESKDKKILYGFCRIRLLKDKGVRQPIGCRTPQDIDILKNSALIRELHVYGELVPIGKDKKIQHSGLGKKLMRQAEEIVRKHEFKKITVISGVGVRGYYRKLGYKLKNTYMIKRLTYKSF